MNKARIKGILYQKQLEKDQYELATKCFNSIWGKINLREPLQHYDVEEIKSKAIERVFARRHLYRKSKGGHFSWTYTIVKNSVLNSLRSRFVQPRKDRKFYTHFKHPEKLRTIIWSENVFEDPIVEYITDMEDETGGRFDLDDKLNQFKAYLGEPDKRILEAVLKSKWYEDIPVNLGLNIMGQSNRSSYGSRRIKHLAALYREMEAKIESEQIA